MSLPDLAPWMGTIRSLHAAMQVLRSARLLGVSALPNELQYGTVPQPTGATTLELSFGGALDLDYGRGAIVHHQDGAERFAVPIAGRSQRALFDEVFARLASEGVSLEPDGSKITGEKELTHDPAAGAGYAEVQWRMLRTIGLVKTRLMGQQTPVMLWPHGFDLSTICFARGFNEDTDPHVNLGFTPGTPDLPEPYLYAYAWPQREGLADAIPPQMSWQTAWGTPGAALLYRDVRDLEPAEESIADILVAAWREARARL